MKTGSYIKCKYCQKEFYVSKCNLGKSKYCSKNCADICKAQDMNGKRKLTGKIIQCGFCKKEIYTHISRISQNKLGIQYCDHECQSKALKAGIAGYGFKQLKKDFGYKKHYKYKVKTIKGVRMYEHRLVMEQKLGRKLNHDEFVHHINGDTKDNRIENLMLVDNVSHGKVEFETNDRLYKSF